jgi:hypothetical protein
LAHAKEKPVLPNGVILLHCVLFTQFSNRLKNAIPKFETNKAETRNYGHPVTSSAAVNEAWVVFEFIGKLGACQDVVK